MARREKKTKPDKDRIDINGVEQALTQREFLRRIDLRREEMDQVLSGGRWQKTAEQMKKGLEETSGEPTAREVLRWCGPLIREITRGQGDEKPLPATFDWVAESFVRIRGGLFPDGFPVEMDVRKDRGVQVFCEILHQVWNHCRAGRRFSPTLDFAMLPLEESDGYQAAEEYRRLKKIMRERYLYEFLRIGAEITPFNTLGHIAGVHHVAMHVARQLPPEDAPVDLAMVSAAAICHDIGKFGCRPEEEERIPYLHYYYTNQCLQRLALPEVAHIAGNHSTWDLELENLPIESLLLIYADFRVKSTHRKGREQIHFYSLQEAFDVILGKLDQVDSAKRDRYIRVYEKLRDFEDYMVRSGVSTDLEKGKASGPAWKDRALLSSGEAVDRLKDIAIEHNIQVMHRMSSPERFATLLEEARSEKQWENVRAYINVLWEYSTYMSRAQKQMTIEFLTELLIHREGDIRRQAASLIGDIIADYEEEYRKELPEGARLPRAQKSGKALWRAHLHRVVQPDLQRTERQRRWMGYSLKITLRRLWERIEEDAAEKVGISGKGSGPEKTTEDVVRIYLKEFLHLLGTEPAEDEGMHFIYLDTLLEVPMEYYHRGDVRKILGYLEQQAESADVEVQMAALRLLKKFATEGGREQIEGTSRRRMDHLADVYCPEDGERGARYLKSFITGSENPKPISASGQNPAMFRDNLKVGTPWVAKAVNIEMMLEELEQDPGRQAFYIASHLSNLLKVSERVTVRHRAGQGLVEIFPRLSAEQQNEIVVELTKGLEIGDYQFSKYIPEYLGVLIMMLPVMEREEILRELHILLQHSNDKVACVTLDTLGVMLRQGNGSARLSQEVVRGRDQRERIIGMLLIGMAHYHRKVSQEAFWVLGQMVFGSDEMSDREKGEVFSILAKKMLTLIQEEEDDSLRFFVNAAALNHIYRFISDYQFAHKKLKIRESRRVAFFPGTFDPFSKGHRGIVTTIRKMGYDVYLALDEFSWSKRTQPRLYRKRIMIMSCAGDTGVFVMPDDLPVNIANPADIKRLRETFRGKELYIVVGSDVIANASSYRAEPRANSIHNMNHIVFRRESQEQGQGADAAYRARKRNIRGRIEELTLPTHLEDISSSRIRDNIDHDRDIASLIDPIAQSYIYDHSLYLREPQYKSILTAQERARVATPQVYPVELGHLYEEFQNQELAEHIRKAAVGRILVIGELTDREKNMSADDLQMILTETLAEALREDFTYAVYHPKGSRRDHSMSSRSRMDERLKDVLERQGFRQIIIDGKPTGCYGVDMRDPVALFLNMDTVLKDPFQENPVIKRTLTEAHRKLQRSLQRLYPNTLILAFESAVMHHKLIRRITALNHVPETPRKKRKLGEAMCVPFGKILNGQAVPNTVTKSLHMEKSFTPDLKGFQIKEYPFYSSIDNQVKTIASFQRPVILVDDILHKGYRIRRLDPSLKENDIRVSTLLVGLLSGRGKDLMAVQGRSVDSIYFIPNLKAWFVESSQYPFIGGDGVERHTGTMDDAYKAINLILPYVSPPFLQRDADNEAIYRFSLTCLENARDILQAIEEEYQKIYQRKLTLGRLSEAIIAPKLTDVGQCLDFDRSLAASSYVEDDIERLLRLRSML